MTGKMIAVAEAEALILLQARILKERLRERRADTADWRAARKVELGESVGRILARPILAERCHPPFHRAAMDGIAISHQEWRNGRRSFRLQGVQKAGQPARVLREPGSCLEIMTGAVLPEGADCVVRVEDITLRSDVAEVTADLCLEPWENVHEKGSDHEAGALLLPPGRVVQSPQVGILASVGMAKVPCLSGPRIAVVSTGDELVELDDIPLPHQIRRSNAYAVRAAIQSGGYGSVRLFHLRDEKQSMIETLAEVLEEQDVVILSGGVSMGEFDFVPAVLADLGVQEIFHKVRQRPGKPLWFGRDERGTVIFGLPGNPVSTLVCVHRYVLPFLDELVASEGGSLHRGTLYAALAEAVRFDKRLALFLPVRLRSGPDARLLAEPRWTNGSGDYGSLADTDGFMELPEERDMFYPAEVFSVRLWR